MEYLKRIVRLLWSEFDILASALMQLGSLQGPPNATYFYIYQKNSTYFKFRFLGLSVPRNLSQKSLIISLKK